MSGHFPFSGNTNRVSVFGFYDRYNLNPAMQEKYYKWWYDWAKNFVINDADLKVVKAWNLNIILTASIRMLISTCTRVLGRPAWLTWADSSKAPFSAK